MTNFLDLTGRRFGKLTVIKRVNNYISPKGAQQTIWECQCDCGNVVPVRTIKLMSGHTKSCGCLKAEFCISTKKKYNEFDITTYEYGVLYIGNEEFLFDKEDYELIKDIYWIKNDSGYAVHSSEINHKTKTIRLHRLIMNAQKGQFIDHKNRNRKDNRKSNLRFCTREENIWNSSKMDKNKTGFIGVQIYKRKTINGYLSHISVNNKSIYLGIFQSINDAIIARLLAEIKYFGKEFAPQRHLFKEYLTDEQITKAINDDIKK